MSERIMGTHSDETHCWVRTKDKHSRPGKQQNAPSYKAQEACRHFHKTDSILYIFFKYHFQSICLFKQGDTFQNPGQETKSRYLRPPSSPDRKVQMALCLRRFKFDVLRRQALSLSPAASHFAWSLEDIWVYDREEERQWFLLAETSKYLENVGPLRQGSPVKNTCVEHCGWHTFPKQWPSPRATRRLLFVFDFLNPAKAAKAAQVIIYL